MKLVKHNKRYIDDGAGFFIGSIRLFNSWINSVNLALSPYGLLIDEFQIKENGSFVPFLDIMFCMDSNGSLQTDLYIKPTDSKSYLHFGSAHPNHVYSGIVYSQCLRLRRIINSKIRLGQKMKNLAEAFIKCGYPKAMVKNISDKVLKSPRILVKPQQPIIDQCQDVVINKIKVVTTFGTDGDIIKAIRNAEPKLLATRSFSKMSKPLFSFVKKTAPSIGSKLAIVKKIALEGQCAGTSKCGSPRCQCDDLIPNTPIPNIVVNGINIRLPKGNCYSRNIIYLCACKLCPVKKYYVGRTVQKMHKRCNGHRAAYYYVLEHGIPLNISKDSEDLYSLGLHLYFEHGCKNKEDFNNAFTLHILEHCSPSQIEKQEHIWIHKLNTLHPCGINKVNPFGLPVWTSLQ